MPGRDPYNRVGWRIVGNIVARVCCDSQQEISRKSWSVKDRGKETGGDGKEFVPRSGKLILSRAGVTGPVDDFSQEGCLGYGISHDHVKPRCEGIV
jgi:hypothetical protein